MPKATKNYFIDLENVGNRWLDILKETQLGDRIDILYTNNGPALHYLELEHIMKSGALFSLTRCMCGNNALDFQLATELGYRVAQDKENVVSYIIVSNDSGFDAVVNYWRERGVSIKRRGVPSQSPAPAAKSAPEPAPAPAPSPAPSPAEKTMQEQYRELLSKHQSISQKDAAQIAAIMVDTMREPLEKRARSTYQRIISMFGKQKGLTVYNQAKATIGEVVKNGPFPPQ